MALDTDNTQADSAVTGAAPTIAEAWSDETPAIYPDDELADHLDQRALPRSSAKDRKELAR